MCESNRTLDAVKKAGMTCDFLPCKFCGQLHPQTRRISVKVCFNALKEKIVSLEADVAQVATITSERDNLKQAMQIVRDAALIATEKE